MFSVGWRERQRERRERYLTGAYSYKRSQERDTERESYKRYYTVGYSYKRSQERERAL